MRRHQASLHNVPKGKIFTCDICDSGFPTAGNLSTHKLKHEPDHIPKRVIKNFFCTQCPQKFRDNHNLKKHYKTHLKPVLNVVNVTRNLLNIVI